MVLRRETRTRALHGPAPSRRPRYRGLAAAAVLALTGGVALAPAYAATGDAAGEEAVSSAQAEASAVRLELAGSPAVSTGVRSATDDGSGETRDGELLPSLALLGDQQLLPVAVLVQDAAAEVTADDALSAACAGLAGDGAAVIALAQGTCLEPAAPLIAGITSLDLTELQLGDVTDAVNALLTEELTSVLDDLLGAGGAGGGGASGPLGDLLGGVVGGVVDPVTGGVLDPVTEALDLVLAEVTPAVQGVVDQLEAGLGGLDLGLRLRAIQATCAADIEGAEGESVLTDVDVVATSDQLGDLVLLTLPTSPAPNTDVLVDLDEVVGLLLDAVATDLETSLAGIASDLTILTTAVQQQVVDTVLAQVAPQLAPLSENLLRLTLNQQSEPEDGALDVTALSAEVLPVAASFGGFSTLADIAIGDVACGPNLLAAAPTGGGGDTPDDTDDPGSPVNPGTPETPATPVSDPQVPTRVTAGAPGLPAAPNAVATLPASMSTTAAAGSFALCAALLGGLWTVLRRREARALATASTAAAGSTGSMSGGRPS